VNLLLGRKKSINQSEAENGSSSLLQHYFFAGFVVFFVFKGVSAACFSVVVVAPTCKH